MCHWFWDVDCSKAKSFYDYSNTRLYKGKDVHLLDDQEVIEQTGAVSHNSERKKRAVQNPSVWKALDKLRGKTRLNMEDILSLISTAKPGQDYPVLSEIPESKFDCGSVQQPGFYADVDTKCQGKKNQNCGKR